MKPSTVPVTGNRLRLEGHLCAILLSDSVKEPAGDPEFVTEVDTHAGSDLVFPLSWHDFGVGARNGDSSVHAGLVMRLNDISAVDTASSDATVVWALGTGEATLGPAVWPAVGTEECVFLLKAEPDLVLRVCFHQSCSFVTVVVLVWCSIRIPSFTHNQDIVAQSDGVCVHCNGSDVDIGIVARGLAS